MGRNSVNCLLVAASLLFLAASESQPTRDLVLWNHANRAYADGKFDQAKADYLQLIAQGNASAELFYNLGNTCLKLDDKGRAVLNFKRSLAVAPDFQPARRNLDLVLQASGAWPQEDTIAGWFAKYPDIWILAGSVSFWILVYACYLRFVSKPLRRLSTVVLAFAIPCTLLSLCLALWVGDGIKSPDLAIIISPTADVRYGPANGSRVVVTLGIGESVHLVSARGAWSLCRSEAGPVGWLPSAAIDRLIPQ